MSLDKSGMDGDIEGENPQTGLRRYSRRMGDTGGESGGGNIWLLSFTDVMALMLTFFVLLFAMSKPKTESWSEITSALQQELNRFYGPALNRGTEDAPNVERANFSRALDITYLAAVIEAFIKENPDLGDVSIFPQTDHLVVALPHDLLFDAGAVTIKPKGVRTLYALGGVLSRIRNQIEIVGHADPSPISGEGGLYKNNWELSLARAGSVAGVMESVGYDREIIVRGSSSGRYQDLDGVIDDEARRLALSRRVDFVILNHAGARKRRAFSADMR